MATFLIVCGGTGGHLAPGIAVAEELLKRGHRCLLIISRKKVDARLIQKYPDLEFCNAPGAPFSMRPAPLMKFLYHQFAGFLMAIRLFLKEKPDLIMGFGGFLTAGFAVPGLAFGIPFVLHEANRVVGRSNRMLSRLAKKVFLPTGVMLPFLRRDRWMHAGLPLRQEFHRMPKAMARERLGICHQGKVLAVFGGSQGASALNDWAIHNARRLAESGVSLYCLTGLGKAEQEVLTYDTNRFGTVKSYMVPFSDNMTAVLSAADVVVSRAGAGSISEIVRCQVPSILIPYPYARDDHQTANARFLEQQGGGIALDQSDLHRLTEEVDDLMFNDFLLKSFRTNLERLDKPTEVKLIATELESMIKARSKVSVKEEGIQS